MSRLVIAGGPRTGKTTLADSMAGQRNLVALHTDDLIEGHSWSEASTMVCDWINEPGPWIIEGVAAVRGLRKWLEAHGGAPCERVIWMARTFEPLTPGQLTMLKGTQTIWRDIVPELQARGVEIEVL